MRCYELLAVTAAAAQYNGCNSEHSQFEIALKSKRTDTKKRIHRN